MFELRSSLCVTVMAAGLVCAGGAAAAGTAQAVTAEPAGRHGTHQRADAVFRPPVTLYRNQALTSGSGRTVLRLQQDGNLVLYKEGRPVWQAPKTWSHGVSAVFQPDGNFVVYGRGGTPIWASGTWHKGAYLAVQDDGNLVIYNRDRRPVWATNTGD
jgi:hypothetical protein